jgi:hypothetical protein
VLLVVIGFVARIEPGIKETDSAVEVTASGFERAIGAVGSGGTIGIGEGSKARHEGGAYLFHVSAVVS